MANREKHNLSDAGVLANFAGNSVLFKFEQKLTGSKGDYGVKAVKKNDAI